MSPAPEEFESLRRLLALKRHEQPPPGYFDTFSSKVIARIEAAGAATPLSWWQRLLSGVELKPALACAYGVLIAALLAVGVTMSGDEEPTGAGPQVARQDWAPVGSLPGSGSETLAASGNNPAATTVSSTAPAFLFDPARIHVQPASFQQR